MARTQNTEGEEKERRGCQAGVHCGPSLVGFYWCYSDNTRAGSSLPAQLSNQVTSS